jgi:hypothetical protein
VRDEPGFLVVARTDAVTGVVCIRSAARADGCADLGIDI